MQEGGDTLQTSFTAYICSSMNEHSHHTSSLIELEGEKLTDCCYYCDDTKSKKAKWCKVASLVLLPQYIDTSASRLNMDVYRLLMNSKCHRHGSHVYQTVNEKTCCPAFTMRCDTEHFRISKTQKRVQMKGETPNDSRESQDVCDGDGPLDHSNAITSSSLRKESHGNINDNIDSLPAERTGFTGPSIGGCEGNVKHMEDQNLPGRVESSLNKNACLNGPPRQESLMMTLFRPSPESNACRKQTKEIKYYLQREIPIGNALHASDAR
ncbi:unnamed protein product [Taenia asiatica]|uniref:ATE_N domain-containing protein n=1 Tax=Taenia asiatica TaxID=60517 RepID=A0A0R3WBJ5_TAEAS|nr:unnamed protein product [Taenia asiatica]